MDKKCDGIRDCNDFSDEDEGICTVDANGKSWVIYFRMGGGEFLSDVPFSDYFLIM